MIGIKSALMRVFIKYPLLDQAALDMLVQAAPLPAVPDDISGSHFRFALPVRFRLR